MITLKRSSIVFKLACGCDLLQFLVPVRGKISALKQELQSSRMASYLTDFASTVEDHTLIVGSVPLQEIQEEERRQREDRVKAELEVIAKRIQAGFFSFMFILVHSKFNDTRIWRASSLLAARRPRKACCVYMTSDLSRSAFYDLRKSRFSCFHATAV